MAEHAPAPWTVLQPAPHNSLFVVVVSADRHKVYEAPCYARTAANACLIAAAPELLDALHLLLTEISQKGVTRAGVNQALAAIAKATSIHPTMQALTSLEAILDRRRP